MTTIFTCLKALFILPLAALDMLNVIFWHVPEIAEEVWYGIILGRAKQ